MTSLSCIKNTVVLNFNCCVFLQIQASLARLQKPVQQFQLQYQLLQDQQLDEFVRVLCNLKLLLYFKRLHSMSQVIQLCTEAYTSNNEQPKVRWPIHLAQNRN